MPATDFPNCSRYGLHPCARNEEIAVLAGRIELAVPGTEPAAACWAATQELTAYDVLGDPRTESETLQFGQARYVLKQFHAAQALQKAA
ncbi:hypothetical protein LRS10_13610 [Phenylobacterium sp. J426]|uniref:hypothetical protein n=1 Tax=Phenylobacterium sp. J426 TaxID=2898439 RepID=UPI002151711D|nr:hypothetical protein [Phenylobacterium sp. J426]MCR5875130.1 hypothetical protein [Phenylobacterium sp. J426]